MVGHGGSSAASYLANPTSPIPSHCASIVATSTVRVKLRRPPLRLAMLFNVGVNLASLPIYKGLMTPVTVPGTTPCPREARKIKAHTKDQGFNKSLIMWPTKKKCDQKKKTRWRKKIVSTVIRSTTTYLQPLCIDFALDFV